MSCPCSTASMETAAICLRASGCRWVAACPAREDAAVAPRPLEDRTRCLAPLSTCITTRIQCSGTSKRLDASVTKAASGWMDMPFARCVTGDARPAYAAPFNSNEAAKTSECTASSRKIARLPSCLRPPRVKRWRASLTAALDRPLRATAVQILAGTKEWRVFLPSKGMTGSLRSAGKVIPPRRSKKGSALR